MNNETIYDVLIIGAGLTGLTAAYQLRNTSLKVLVVEARSRVGGRIYTLGFKEGRPVEMGATWLGNKHENLVALLDELGIETFEQVIGEKAIYEAISTSPHYLATLPENPEPSLRIKGGTHMVIKKMMDQIDDLEIGFSQEVKYIIDRTDHLEVKNDEAAWKARKVITTLPPNLLGNVINFLPELSNELVRLTQQTHTWMGESIKIALTYDKPFWRSNDVAGTIISNVGPIPEMYDHSNYEDNYFCLMGFLNGSYHAVDKEDRLAMILQQLEKYFGAVVHSYQSYSEKVWNKEKETYFPYESPVIPHQYNGHQVYQQTYMNDKLMIAGTETSAVFPGYMEGAVYSAKKAASWAKNNIK